MTHVDLIGKTVRVDFTDGTWMTAHIHGHSPRGAFVVGTCVDPGTCRTWDDPPQAGDHLPSIRPALCTVIDSEPVAEDEECE
jgi:hypothetical protein